MDRARSTLVLAAFLTIALSGCFGGGDDGGDDNGTGTGTTTGTSTRTSTMTTGTGTGGPGPMPTEQFVNGTVSGVADCTFLGAGVPTVGGSDQQVPAGMGNGTYALEVVTDPTGQASLCLVFDDGTSGLTGSVPAGATSFTVYADAAPQAVSYSVRFTPA